MTKEDRAIKRDRLRYTKNSLSSGLALAAIVFNVLYFVSIYRSDVGSWYYQALTGLSIVYNLVFMLFVFLASEGVKNYKTGYAIMLLVVGALQIGRIFILPEKAYGATVTLMGEELKVMETPQYMWIVIFLSASALCCILAAITSICKNIALASHMASLKKKAA